MKIAITATVLLSFFLTQKIYAHDPAYKPCKLACQEIPLPAEVLYSAGHSALTELPSTRLRVLAWNVYKGKKKDFPEVFSILSKNKDVILLSEATTGDTVAPSLVELPGFGWNLAASFLMKNGIGSGAAIGSMAGARNVRFYRTNEVEPFVFTPKTIIVGEYAIAGRAETLLVLSIHGINWAGNSALERQLRMVLPDLKAHQGPIIFAGDFNTKNKERIVLTEQVLAEAGLQRVPWEKPNYEKQLDDAYTRGIKVHNVQFITDYVDIGSDHPAIDLDVEIL